MAATQNPAVSLFDIDNLEDAPDVKAFTAVLAGQEIAANKTYGTNPPAPEEFEELLAVREFFFGVVTGDPIMFKGPPGVGKSSMIRDLCKAAELECVVINAPNIAPEELALPMPINTGTEMVLDFMLYKELTNPAPKVLVIEELSRATDAVRNQLLELVQERRLGDIEVPNVRAVFSNDNISAEDGITKQYDLAMADRWHTVVLDANDTPWRRALAAQFYDTDLSAVFAEYNLLSPRLRYLLSPRTLEHVLWNVHHGNPAEWGLPLIASKRQLLIDENGTDRTDEILDRIAHACERSNPSTVGDRFERAVEMAINHGKNLYIEGPPGIGKTSYLRTVAETHNVSVKVLSAPVVSPENLVVPFPKDGELDLMLMRWFAEPGKKVLVIDEGWRCSAAVRNKFMEILQEKSLGGKPIEGLQSVIMLNNPREVAGHRLDVGRPDRAQADRFFMSIAITARDVPWGSHLIRKYGDIAAVFLDWWQEGLDDLGRLLVTGRGIERMIKRYQTGQPLEAALPHIGGEPVAVSLYDLELALADRPLARLSGIVENIDRYIDNMTGPDGAEHPNQIQVLYALQRADLEQLEKNMDAVVRLLGALNRQNKLVLVRSTGSRQKFWVKALVATR